MAISSSDCRARVRSGKPVWYLVPDGVVQYISKDRLYRTREHPLYDGSTYLHGFGHYHETYVKRDVGWRLLASRLTRLRVEMKRVL